MGTSRRKFKKRTYHKQEGTQFRCSCSRMQQLTLGTLSRDDRKRASSLCAINSAPILWHSKRQATVEASTFGSSEFVAFLRTGVEMNDGFSIQTSNDGNSKQNKTCDRRISFVTTNQSVVNNSTNPE